MRYFKTITVSENLGGTGIVLDVIVDLRKDSPTYKQWESYILSVSNHHQPLVPRDIEHGLWTLTDNVNFVYK